MGSEQTCLKVVLETSQDTASTPILPLPFFQPASSDTNVTVAVLAVTLDRKIKIHTGDGRAVSQKDPDPE